MAPSGFSVPFFALSGRPFPSPPPPRSLGQAVRHRAVPAPAQTRGGQHNHHVHAAGYWTGTGTGRRVAAPYPHLPPRHLAAAALCSHAGSLRARHSLPLHRALCARGGRLPSEAPGADRSSAASASAARCLLPRVWATASVPGAGDLTPVPGTFLGGDEQSFAYQLVPGDRASARTAQSAGARGRSRPHLPAATPTKAPSPPAARRPIRRRLAAHGPQRAGPAGRRPRPIGRRPAQPQPQLRRSTHP